MAAITVFEAEQAGYELAVESLRRTLTTGELTSHSAQLVGSVRDTVHDILSQVEKGGDQAAAQLGSKLDRANLTPQNLRVPPEELEAAHLKADPEFLGLMRRAAANIQAYQEHILWKSPEPLVREGRRLGVRYLPMERVAVYVPGGRALYPSSVLMAVVPARVAGVREVIIMSPPTGGDIDPMAKALAWELGVEEVYRLGGAVGLAAAAYGTETIRPVDKIVGPGNAFVGEAKKQLFGKVGIDSIAGPSEVFIVADDSADPAWVAADLLAQAEHDPGSAILATPSQVLAMRVQQEVEAQLDALERREAAAHSLRQYGGIIVTSDLPSACELANRFATEHLQIITRCDEECMARIKSAGAIFLGAHTPVPLGDYIAGPSHVLPTGGTARFSAPLSCNQFLKTSSVLQYNENALGADAVDAASFAAREGLTAHAKAVSIRATPAK